MNLKKYTAANAELSTLREIFINFFKETPLYEIPANDDEFEKMLSQAVEIYKLIKN